MERLTDCAQGYCEMYCKKYGHCFEDPDDCIFKDEIKMYDALKSIEGIVPFDRLLELADADRAGRLVVLPCKVGDTLFDTYFGDIREKEVVSVGFMLSKSVKHMTIHANNFRGAITEIEIDRIGKEIFYTREEAEAALKGGEG